MENYKQMKVSTENFNFSIRIFFSIIIQGRYRIILLYLCQTIIIFFFFNFFFLIYI